MGKFAKAAVGKAAGMRTENGMPTMAGSANRVLDLFFKMGGWPNNPDLVLASFIEAYREDPLLAMKCLFYHRDIRGGQGRRDNFRHVYNWLCLNHPKVAAKNMVLLPEFGRWDDVFCAVQTSVESVALYIIADALKNESALAAKWAPSEGKEHKLWYRKLRDFMGLTAKEYRQVLTACRKVVERQMCGNEWKIINYNHVPSQAIKKYRTAWYRHDQERYEEWLDNLKSGAKGAKVNAGAIYPHDVVRQAYYGVGIPKQARDLIVSQWKALPNYMVPGSMVLCMADVSGSMGQEGILISTTIAAYTAERNTGPFQDLMLTFSRVPKFIQLTGDIVDRTLQIRRTDESPSNTDLQAAYLAILNLAVCNKLPESEMPKYLVIISDMQFDQACPGTDTAQQMASRMYRAAGYKLPNIIYWNVRTSNGVPVQFDQRGTALVSGFSPSILPAVLSGEVDPMKVMLRKLNSERYAKVSVVV
jgi:hypothetical protein